MSGVDRIGGTGAIRPGSPRHRPAGGFSLADDATPAAAAGPASPVGLAALLALQDEEERPRNRAARRHARALLDELDALHRALLGAGGFAGLSRLSALLDDRPAPADDPALRALVDDIGLRARIELARREPPATDM